MRRSTCSPASHALLESLEDRIAPATIVVDSLTDDGVGMTLRDAIALAESTAAHDTIVFSSGIVADGSTISLSMGQLLITKPLTIKGPGMDKMTINGAGMGRIFNIDDGNPDKHVRVTISGLTLTNGSAAGSGGPFTTRNPCG